MEVQSLLINSKYLQEPKDPVELQLARQQLQELNADIIGETENVCPTDGEPHVLTIVPLLM